MRIVHVADSFAPDIGGIERQVEGLAIHQLQDGHDVVVVTAVSDRADIDSKITVVRAAAGRWLTVAFPWRNWRMVASVLDAKPVDIVHAHFSIVSPLAVYVARAASRRGIPVAVTVHSLWWKVALATRISNLAFGWGLTKAAWSGVSTVAAERVRRTLPHIGEVSTVPNLVDTHWWRSGPPRATRPDQVALILVGRLKKRKHLDKFFTVLPLVRAQISPTTKVSVTVVGDGPRRAGLRRQIEKLQLTDWVTLVGHRKAAEIRSLLHESDLFVASSRHESFGIAALEARAAGVPVLSYRGNGTSDFIVDGVDGLLVPNAAAMVAALVRLLTEPDELPRLRTTTINCAPSIGTKQVISAIDDLYARALAMRAESDVPNKSRRSSDK